MVAVDEVVDVQLSALVSRNRGSHTSGIVGGLAPALKPQARWILGGLAFRVIAVHYQGMVKIGLIYKFAL